METKALVESLETWDLIAVLSHQLVVTHLVLKGLHSFTCRMGELGEIIYSQTMLIIDSPLILFKKDPILGPHSHSGKGKRKQSGEEAEAQNP